MRGKAVRMSYSGVTASRGAVIFLLTGLSVLLGGCFDYNQSVAVQKTGEAVYSAEVVLPPLVVRLLEADGTPFSCKDSFNPIPKPGVQFEVDDFTRVNNRICRYKASGRLDALSGLKFNRNSTTETTGFRVEELGHGRYRLVASFADFNEDMGAPELMASALLQGHFVRFDVTAPKILSTNGTIVENGKRARWQRPLADLVTQTGSDPVAFVAEIEIPHSLWDRFLAWISAAWNELTAPGKD